LPVAKVLRLGETPENDKNADDEGKIPEEYL
jgi:hypothetical protein